MKCVDLYLKTTAYTAADPTTVNEAGQMSWPHNFGQGDDGSSSDLVTGIPDTKHGRLSRPNPLDPSVQQTLSHREGGSMDWNETGQESSDAMNHGSTDLDQASPRPEANIMSTASRIEAYLIEADNWSQEVTDSRTRHTPPGTFEGNAKEIVRKILKFAKGDRDRARREIQFYVNRGGKDLPNKTNLDDALKLLRDKTTK